MFLFLILTPASIVMPESRAAALRFIQPVMKLSKVQQIQDQFSSVLVNSDKVTKQIAVLLKERLDKSICHSYSLIYPLTSLGCDNWVNIAMVGNKTGFNDLKQEIQVSVESSLRLSDELIDELEKYSFALYKVNNSGKDLMSLRKSFDRKSFYQYGVSLDFDKVNLIPSWDFQSTVRRNYFQNDSANSSIAVLVFRKDKIGTQNLDYLLISDL